MSTDEWETPPWLWHQLDSIFHFEWDACSKPENVLVGESGDALHGNWPSIVFMNPPYSKPEPFLRKAQEQSLLGVTTVALIKGDPSTRWWNDWVKDYTTLVWLPKRLRFWYQGKPGKYSANFPSVIAIYWGRTWVPEGVSLYW